MHNNSALIYLGRINGVHGIRGWVKIHSECRPRTAIFNYPSFIAQRSHHSDTHTLILHAGKQQGKGLIAKFDGIDDRDAAYSLNGIDLYVPRSALPTPAANEYYWSDLIGTRVINQHGEILGETDDLFETGANDVLIVKTTAAEEILIPFVIGQYITDIDLDNGEITVDWERHWSSDK